jgi:hypothetical protein
MDDRQGTSRDQYASQGKSNNYLAAQAAGRFTAGQAARVLSKRFGRKIAARDLEPLACEFHHAGRFGRDKARRVFFFSAVELELITLADVERAAAPVWGWRLGFRAEYGRYGRKFYRPIVAEVGLFAADRAFRLGDKFHPLASAQEAAEARAAVGKTLPAYCADWRQAE